jgi:cardiolipin synthase
VKRLPNVLSLARLLMAPVVGYLIWKREYGWVLDVLVVAAATDAADGWLARRMGAESRLGVALDPIADKALLSGASLALAVTGAMPWWLAGIVLGRDALILAVAGALVARGGEQREFPPSLWGKLSTVAQVAYVLAVVVSNAGLGLARTVVVLSFVVAALTVWSGLDYGRRLAARGG